MPAMAMVPFPSSPASNKPPTETCLLPAQRIPGSWTGTDSTPCRTHCENRASHAAARISFARRDHQYESEEAKTSFEARRNASEEAREADAAFSSSAHGSEGGAGVVNVSFQAKPGGNNDGGDSSSSCFSNGEKPVDSQACFQMESITRQRAVECLSHSVSSLADGMLLHSYLIESGFELQTFEKNTLMHMYGNFGAMEDARFTFNDVQRPNVVSWNTLMSSHMHQKRFSEVLGLFSEMYQECLSPDSITVTIALRSCSGLAAFSQGRLIHFLVVVNALEAEAGVGTSLALMYARCGAWKEAIFVFDRMQVHDVFTWTAMILASFELGRDQDTLLLFKRMLQEGRVPNKVVLIAVLRSCANLLDLNHGKAIHEYISKSSFACDDELASFMVAMYGKCGAVNLASSVFESMSTRTVASYNAMIAGYLSQNLHKNAFQLVHQMVDDNLTPDEVTCSKIVEACEGCVALEDVRDLHSHLIKFGLDLEIRMKTAIVTMYCKFGEIEEACFLLLQLSERDALGWNILLAMCVRLQRSQECMHLFQQMLSDGVDPNKETLFYVLSSCAHLSSVQKGMLIHGYVIEAELERDAAMGSSLISMYGKCGALEDACCVFSKISDRNVSHWTSMIAVNVHQGRPREALQHFNKMQQEKVIPNRVTFTSVLNACANLGALTEGQTVHALIKDSELVADPGVANALLHMYCKCGSLDDARVVFEAIVKKSVVSWSVLISAYIEQDHYECAIQLFQRMQKEGVIADEGTFVSVLRACAGLECPGLGYDIHNQAVQRGIGFSVVFATSLIRMYGVCGGLQEACWVFHEIKEHNVVTWTSIIAVHAQQGQAEEAIELFHQMKAEGWEPDGVTLACVLSAYADLKVSVPHDVLQACNFKSDVLVGNALINVYAKCGDIRSASSVFEKMHERNVATWNTIISAYGQNCYGSEALKLLQRARQERMSPDDVTWCHCLGICADLGSLVQGKLIHKEIIVYGYDANVGLGNALINMYGKCGAMEEATFVFSSMQRDIVSWNAILAVLSQQGHIKGVIWVLRRMKMEGIKADEVTFVSVLNTCSRLGLLKDGCDFFKWMRDGLNMPPTFNHYGCLIDLFGKAGFLDVAEDLICSLPFCTTALLWMTLLSSCRKHGDLERGERALDYVSQLDPCNAAPYVLMSSIYAAHERWTDVKILRAVMLKKGIHKQPGVSMIEIDDQVHCFFPRDRRHPETHAIYGKLDRLNQQMKEQGYLPDTRLVLQDVDEESKRYMLCHHSERLALAFGLIRTQHKEPLFIVKNLQMCADCHAAFKLISKIVDRKITLRDAGRFHCFSNGLCSCGDYW